MKGRAGIIILPLILFCGMCIIENSAVSSRPRQAADQNSASIYMLAGEFRTVFANLLWMKADQYHDEFTERNPNWTQNKDLLGLLDIITTLDPTFIEAYADAAYIQADGCKAPKKALDTLHKGIIANPKAWELYLISSIMYIRRLHDPKTALPYAIQAAKYADDDFSREKTKKLLHTVRELNKARSRQSSPSNHQSI